jgi:4a-hydroxytetrahydrobiopterin dehydratase
MLDSQATGFVPSISYRATVSGPEDRAMTLAREKCVACRRDSPRVPDEEIAELRPGVPDWVLTDIDEIKRLDRTFKVGDFAAAMQFASQVAVVAEEEGHHPRLTVEWGRVNVAWWTHKIRGLHRNDFVMAAKTDEVYSRLT